MSIERCMIHDRNWDSDFMDACPSCMTHSPDGASAGGPLAEMDSLEQGCRMIHEAVSEHDADELIHHPAQKSWEEPTEPRWKQWIEVVEAIFALSPSPGLGGSAGADIARTGTLPVLTSTPCQSEWDWLNAQINLELSYGFYDEEEEGEWQVHRVSGGRNDREWELVGNGATALLAVQCARVNLSPPQTQSEGER